MLNKSLTRLLYKQPKRSASNATLLACCWLALLPPVLTRYMDTATTCRFLLAKAAMKNSLGVPKNSLGCDFSSYSFQIGL